MAWTKRTGIMLCQPLDEHNLDRNFKDAPKMLVQPKLDGMRAWVRWEDGEPLLISSEGNVIEGVPHINFILKEQVHMEDMPRVPFDGELYSHKLPFEDIIGICKRSGDNLRENFTDIEYHIFDYKGTEPNLTRWQFLKKWAASWENKGYIKDILRLVETYVASREMIDAFLEMFVANGYEGIIVRNPLAPYIEKRPYTILKWKPSKSDIYEIEEVEEAVSETGERLARVGGLVLSDRFGNLFSAGPGRGITHAVAKDMWINKEKWRGRNVRVQYQNLTQAGVPRFGKFLLDLEPTEDREEHLDA